MIAQAAAAALSRSLDLPRFIISTFFPFYRLLGASLTPHTSFLACSRARDPGSSPYATYAALPHYDKGLDDIFKYSFFFVPSLVPITGPRRQYMFGGHCHVMLQPVTRTAPLLVSPCGRAYHHKVSSSSSCLSLLP
jgi:hypothetical protein